MRVLMISSDRDLFKEGSDTCTRHREYGALFEEIHIIVFSHKNLGNKNIKIGDNVFVYPTNHICKFFYLWDIYKIAKNIIKSSGYRFCHSALDAESRKKELDSRFRGNDGIGNLSLIVSAQDPFESGLAAWMLKKIYKIPLQIQIHTDFLSPYFWRESFVNKLRVILAKFLIPRADGIRVVSNRIKISLVASGYLLASITVLPIFIDVESIKCASIDVDLHKKYSQFDFIILMASRLTREKNIGMAIGAMAELVHPRTQALGGGAKIYPKLGLVIVGSGPELGSCKSLVVSRRLENNVIFEPAVDHDTLFSYYKTADIFLLTSNYEGYGRTVIEAMSIGLPVIMTDVGLAGETPINDENGVVVPVGDKRALVDSISSLIANKGKRDWPSVSAVKTIAKLTTKEHYLELYKQSVQSCILKD